MSHVPMQFATDSGGRIKFLNKYRHQLKKSSIHRSDCARRKISRICVSGYFRHPNDIAKPENVIFAKGLLQMYCQIENTARSAYCCNTKVGNIFTHTITPNFVRGGIILFAKWELKALNKNACAGSLVIEILKPMGKKYILHMSRT